MLRDPLSRVRIRYKLPLTFLALCVVAFGIGGVVLTTEARGALEVEIRRRLDERAAATALIVGYHLDLHRHRVEDFASDGFIRSQAEALAGVAPRERAALGGGLARHLAENKLSLVGAFVGATAYAVTGDVLVATPPDMEGDPSTAPTEGTVLGPMTPASARHPYPTFRISTPLWSLAGGRRVGTLQILLRADHWVRSMAELDALPPASLDAGRILAPSGVELTLPPGGPLSTPKGERMTDRRPLGDTGWTLLLETDRAHAMAPADRLRDQYLGIGLVLLLVTAGVLFFPVRFLVRPLSKIAEAARRIGAGDFTARAEHESGDEIGDLARAFDVMAAAVEDRTRRLESAAETLRRREADVRLERDRLATVIRSMEDGLFILDGDGRVTLSNAAARPVLDVLAREAGRRLECGPGGRSPDPCLVCLADVDRGQHACVVEHEGRIYDLRTTVLPAAPGAAPSRLCMSRDVTARIGQQEAQAHQERLAVLGEIAAVMAHELNNPLGAIAMFSQMLGEQLEPGSAAREAADVIRRNVDACKRTIHGLLDLAARGRVETAPLDLHDLLEDVRAFLGPLTRRAHVDVLLDLAAGDAVVVGDEVRLRQVLVNLVMNGVQACGSGGKVSIRTGEDEEDVEVVVADSGAGIPAAVRERIFEPFFTTKGAGAGTGLGLPTSRRVVEEHGGTLTLEASGPEGTTFRIRLPRQSAVRRWESQARLTARVGSARAGGPGQGEDTDGRADA